MRKAIIITAAILLAHICAMAQNTFCYGNLHYRITSANTVAVSAEDPKMSGNVAIPERIMQDSVIYTITAVDNGGFENCKGIRSMVLPAKISKIGKRAFANCENLNTINIPYAVREIEESSFEGCRSLTGITIPDGVTTIGEAAFRDCDRLIRFIVPDACTYIGDYALWGCGKIQAITIPAKLERIGRDVFRGCNELLRFAVEKENTHFESINEALIWKSKEQTSLIRYPSKRQDATVEIPAHVTEICEYAFECADNVVLIKTNQRCSVIQNYAFFCCQKLQKIEYTSGLQRIGEFATFGSPLITCDNIPGGVSFISAE